MKSKESIICYDLMIVPHGWGLDRLHSIAKETGYLFYDPLAVREMGYDSKPYMIDGKPTDKIFIDISTEEGKKIYDKVIKEMDNEK